MRILLVEDSDRLRRSVGSALRKSGFAVDTAADGPTGLWMAGSVAYDAIVLDIMLPGLSGIALVRMLRKAGRQTHVLLLTARDAIEDRVLGLQAGADDYLVKPFALDELLARVQALCRRAYGTKAPRLVIDDLEIDTSAMEVRRGGELIPLKPREYQLLEYLARRAGEVVTRSDIEAHIYGDDVDPMSNVVDSAVSLLRKKLGRVNSAALIHTRHGIGYILKASN